MYLGEALVRLDRREEARAVFGQARALQTALVADYPERAGYRSELAATLGDLADLLRADGQLEAARDLAQQAIDHQKKCLATTPDDPDCLRFMLQHEIVLGDVLVEMKEYGGAVAAFQAGFDVGSRQRLSLRELAVACAQALAAVGAAVDADEADVERWSHALATLALTLFERLVAADPAARKDLLESPDFAPLREREEFIAWAKRS
jgi:tetratricopeptide (TPR) repeat protein